MRQSLEHERGRTWIGCWCTEQGQNWVLGRVHVALVCGEKVRRRELHPHAVPEAGGRTPSPHVAPVMVAVVLHTVRDPVGGRPDNRGHLLHERVQLDNPANVTKTRTHVCHVGDVAVTHFVAVCEGRMTWCERLSSRDNNSPVVLGKVFEAEKL